MVSLIAPLGFEICPKAVNNAMIIIILFVIRRIMSGNKNKKIFHSSMSSPVGQRKGGKEGPLCNGKTLVSPPHL